METYDFVVVGAGSAGCILAARLASTAGVSVLLLEAGSRRPGFWSRIPLGVGRILNDRQRTWRLQTQEVPSAGGVARTWLSGKCLGGSSAVNGMVAVRGDAGRYDTWADTHAPGWSYAECLPAFKTIENWQGPARASRGDEGPIGISLAERDPLSDRFLAAAQGLGYEFNADYNDDFRVGASYLQLSVRNGKRCDAGTAFLRNRRSGNLHILLDAQAERVVFAKGRAVAVQARVRGVAREFTARREVVICAGAVRSPQLLELSGVGSSKRLLELGLPVVMDLPHVGEHLQDHVMARICFTTTEQGTVNALVQNTARLAGEALKYAFTGRGMFAGPSLAATLFAASPSQVAPDIRIQLGLVSAKDRIPDNIREGLDPGSAFHLGVYGIYPCSRGCVHSVSPDAGEPPEVQPNYLADLRDRQVLLAGLRIARAISRTSPLKEVILEEIRPGAGCESDDELLAYASATAQTCWHPVSTCRMGAAGESVVDQECRVHGLAGLRVVDASVFPLMPSSNTNLPTMMLAERVAQLMRRSVDTAG